MNRWCTEKLYMCFVDRVTYVESNMISLKEAAILLIKSCTWNALVHRENIFAKPRCATVFRHLAVLAQVTLLVSGFLCKWSDARRYCVTFTAPCTYKILFSVYGQGKWAIIIQQFCKFGFDERIPSIFDFSSNFISNRFMGRRICVFFQFSSFYCANQTAVVTVKLIIMQALTWGIWYHGLVQCFNPSIIAMTWRKKRRWKYSHWAARV